MAQINSQKRFIGLNDFTLTQLPKLVFKNGKYFSKLYRQKEGLKPYVSLSPNLRSKPSISDSGPLIHCTCHPWRVRPSGRAHHATQWPGVPGWHLSSFSKIHTVASCAWLISSVRHHREGGHRLCSPFPPEPAPAQGAKRATVSLMCHNYFTDVFH